MEKMYIGIDIGGTSIKGSAMNKEGKLIENKFVLPINSLLKQEEIIDQLIVLLKQFIEENNLNNLGGIGIGIPGSIDSEKGVVTFANNLHWKGLEIVKIFKNSFDLPVKITNDANAAALGESIFGAGKKYHDVVMITLGTGVGSGIVIDGKLFEGTEGKGGEIGHTTLVYDGLPCSCGRKGCFEMYASANALTRQSKEAMDKNPNSLMWEEMKKNGKLDARIAFNAAKRNDETSLHIVQQYVSYLSEGLLNICNSLRPECIVLSGGVANEGEYLINRIKQYCEKFNYGYPYSPKTEIKVAELGYESGIIGAACLCL